MPTKLTIYELTDPKDASSIGLAYSCQLNPEQITHNRSITINEEQGANTAGSVNQMQAIQNEEMSFDLFLDGTGVIAEATREVDDEILHLRSIVYDYEGEIHKPKYLLISYKSIKFVCHLTSMNVSYTLFRPDGSALRAKVSLSFKQFKDNETREKEAQKSSPDMTHVKTVREGDSLPLMCREIYGKMDYYLQVAEVNGLSNFRELEVGSQLVFPPLEK